MRTSILFFALILAVAMAVNCSSEKKPAEEAISVPEQEVKAIIVPADVIVTESGLKYVDNKVGDGAMPEKGQRVVVHYTGKLMDGSKFDSSYDRNEPIEFSCGINEMIAGFDEGILTMKVGGKRTMYIPADLAYGEQGIPNVIPPNAMIVFEVELVGMK